MNKIDMKLIMTYIWAPILILAYIIVCKTKVDALIILQREVLITIGYIIVVRDIKEKKISNTIILILMIAWAITMLPKLIVDLEGAFTLLKSSMLGFVVGGGLFIIVYLISKKGLGGGDVKFMAVAGLYLGIDGILPVMLYGSILASLFGIIMIVIKKMNRKDTMPLAPFLYLGILLTIFFL